MRGEPDTDALEGIAGVGRRSLLAAAATGIGIGLAGCLSEDDTGGEPTASGSGDGDASTGDGGDASEDDDDPADGTDEQADDTDDLPEPGFLTATLHTSEGDVEVELYGERVPRTVDNFVGLATGDREWYHPDPARDEVMEGPLYDDVPFHRVIDDFMVQTGDPTGTGAGGPGYRFDDEFHPELRHDDAGVLSMANSGPDTNGSQFFVTLAPTPWLDGHHSVFGQVTDGMDVVREIGAAETDSSDRPVEEILLESVTIHDA